MKEYPDDLSLAEKEVMRGFVERLIDETSMYDYFYAWLPEDQVTPRVTYFKLPAERIQELYRMALDKLDIPVHLRLDPSDPRHEDDGENPVVTDE